MLEILHIWKPVVEILILWFMIYHILLFFEGTRAIQVLRGIIILLITFFLAQRLGLDILDWLLSKLFGISIIAVLIIFHPEIRQGLARLGQRHLFGSFLREEELDCIIREIIKSVYALAEDKTGALIAIEKKDSLAAYVESGVLIDARVSADLIQAIFTPHNLLHDGGLVIQHGRLIAAGCLFPLSQNQDLARIFGTRHRAALGLSEETDALVVIVSEERQDVSLTYGGKLYRDLKREDMFSKLNEFVKAKKEDGKRKS